MSVQKEIYRKVACLILLSVSVTLLDACGGGGGGSGGSLQPSVLGTWAVSGSNGQETLVVDESTYMLQASPSGNVCNEFGQWSLSGTTMTISPEPESSCGRTSPYTETVDVTATSLSLTDATGTTTFQWQADESASNAVGTWTLMDRVTNGQGLDVSSYGATLVLGSSIYSYSEPSINSTNTACTETGTWSASGTLLTAQPDSSSDCGNVTAYTETVSLDGSLMTLDDGSKSDIYELQSGISGGSGGSVPTQVTANSGSSGVTLAWTAVTGATSYNIYRSTSSGTETQIASGVTSASYTDTTVAAGTTYYYVITAVVSGVESSWSSEVSVAVSGSTGAASISWTSSAAQIGIPSTDTLVGVAANGTGTITIADNNPGNTNNTYYSTDGGGTWNYLGGNPSTIGVYWIDGLNEFSLLRTDSAILCNDTNFSMGWIWDLQPGTVSHGAAGSPTLNNMVVVGDAGTIYETTDPNNYNFNINGSFYIEVSGTNSTLRTVAWVGNEYLAGGDGGTMIASTDGLSWTSVTTGLSSTDSIYGIANSGTVDVAVGGNGTQGLALYSTDGVNWSPATLPTSQADLSAVTWDGTEFVAVGASGSILASTDGATWSKQTSNTSNDLYGIAWTGSELIAVGANATVLVGQ